jgi:hypothetical protein
MVVGPRSKVNVKVGTSWYYAMFSHVNVTAHQLTISGLRRSCSGTGTSGWKIYQGRPLSNSAGWRLRLTKIRDACKARVNLFAPHNWDWGAGQRSLN